MKAEFGQAARDDDHFVFGAGEIRDWSSWELNLWRRVESAWIVLSDPNIEVKKPTDSGWEYSSEATDFLDALEHFFEELDPRIRAEDIPWNKGSFTQCLAQFEDLEKLYEAALWDSITFLRSVTRFSRFPDNNDGGWFADHLAAGGVQIAMARLNHLTAPTVEDGEAVLSLKPIFDSLTVEEFRSWNGWEPMDLPEGGQVLHVPYPEYHPVVEQWWNLLYDTPFYISPYGRLPEDPSSDGVPFSVMGAHFPLEYFENATLAQVRRYMLLCSRGERFCNGHIAGEFEKRVIHASFARLEQLIGNARANPSAMESTK